jgi:hypothetical protein
MMTIQSGKKEMAPSRSSVMQPGKGGFKSPLLYLLISVVLNVAIVIRSGYLDRVSNRELGILPPTVNSRNVSSIDICFVASQFAASSSNTDKLFNVTKSVPTMNQSPHYHFFAFSNLRNLNAPGWTVVVKDLGHYNRFITQSRWPKFQAFKEPIIQKTCQVVFYIDGIISPHDVPDDFQNEARKILESSVQFAQRLHPAGGGAEDEFKRIKRQKKDIKANIKASLRWLNSQPDYDKNCTLYENNMFGYGVHSMEFQKAANFFWDHYEKEGDSWRGKK